MGLLAHPVTETFDGALRGSVLTKTEHSCSVFLCLFAFMFALTDMCEGHTDAAYIASRRMAPHLYVPHTVCFESSSNDAKRGEVGEYGAIRRAAM